MAWHRSRLLALVKAQRSRAAHCIWVPLWLIFVVAAAASFLSTADVSASSSAYSFLQSRLRTLGSWNEGGGVIVSGTGGVTEWLHSSWIPALTDDDARAVIVGGLRLSQWRGMPGCAGAGLSATTIALLPASGTGAQCAPGSTLATAPYGLAAVDPDSPATRPFRLRADASTLGGLKSAYSAVLRGDSGTGAPATIEAVNALTALDTSHWLDSATMVAEGGALALIPALRRWIYLTARITADGGGVFSGTVASCALPVEATGVTFTHVIFVIGAVIIALVTLVHFFRILNKDDGCSMVRCGARVNTLRTDSTSWWILFGFLFDIGLVVSVFTVIGLSSNAASLAAALRAGASAAATGGAPSPSSTDMGTLQLHALAAAACDARNTWLEAAAACALFIGARSVRLLSLSPRVSVVGAAFAASLTDILHCGALLGAVFGLFVLFAHGAFGAAVPSLSDPSAAAFALLRMVMFDVPFDAMTGANAKLAAAFFALYMLLFTHALFWAWLGISLEAFSICRSELRDTAPHSPTLLDDAVSGLAVAKSWVTAAANTVLHPQAPRVVSPWSQRAIVLNALESLHAALQPSPLSSEYITAAELGDALRSPYEAAARAAKAVSSCDDVSAEFREALSAIVMRGNDGLPLSPPLVEEIFGSPVDMSPPEPGYAAPPPAAHLTIAVRGMLLRVNAPPSLERMEVATPTHATT